MEKTHDIIQAVIGESADCDIECVIPVVGYKPLELPELAGARVPVRFVFEKEADQDRLAENFVVGLLGYSDSSAESLLNDRKNTIASEFKNFKNLVNKVNIDPKGYTECGSWVSYFDDKESTNKVAYIAYVKGTRGVIGYEATVKLTQGVSIETAGDEILRNYRLVLSCFVLC
jgi:hypothetical protein